MKSLEEYMTPQRQLIAELWNAGNSAGVIAKKLAITRNAVVGLVMRMRSKGIELRRAGMVRSEKKIRAPRHRPATMPPVVTPEPVPPVEVKSPEPLPKPKPRPPLPQRRPKPTLRPGFMPPLAPRPPPTAERWVVMEQTLKDTCRYPNEEGKFCNAPGFPWCEEHRKKCFKWGKPGDVDFNG